MRLVARDSGGRTDADLDLSGLMEAGDFREPGQQFGRQKTQLGCAGSIPAGHDENRSPDIGDLTIVTKRLRQQSPQLGCPGFLIGRLTQ